MLGDLAWWITLVILIREIGITLLRLAVIRYGVIAASPGGKAKTLVQIIAIGLYILPLPESLHWLAAGTMGLAVILTVVTGVDYVIRAAVLYARARRPAGQPPTSGPA
jgi:CDP-diacylglycerol--glycerol-3-phosphate 3-phosphatidyltransferase